MSTVTIQDVKVSAVQNGKNNYSVAEVVYTDSRGENKNKKIMSFSNPAVFAFVSKIKNPTKVVVENSGAPYYNWVKIDAANDEEVVAAKAAPKSSTYNDTRETPEERARRQLMIVKQSSLSNAINYWSEIKKINNPDYDFTVEEIITTAQQFVDWVMEDPAKVLEGSD